LNCPVAPFEIT